jgi:hypothetical protein
MLSASRALTQSACMSSPISITVSLPNYIYSRQVNENEQIKYKIFSNTFHSKRDRGRSACVCEMWCLSNDCDRKKHKFAILNYMLTQAYL